MFNSEDLKRTEKHTMKMKQNNKQIIRKYFNKYFKSQHIEEQDIEFKALVGILNKKDKNER